MSLEKRIKRLEKEGKQREIRSWLDLVKFAEQKKGEKIGVNGAWGEFVKRVERHLKRSTHL